MRTASELRKKAHRHEKTPVEAPKKSNRRKVAVKAQVKRPVGRPPTPVIPLPPRKEGVIDLVRVRNYAFIHCTEEEIATLLHVPLATLSANLAFQEVYKEGLRNGKKSLRRWMFEQAEKGNVVMQIWLSKNQLGFREPPHEVGGLGGKPIQTEAKIVVESKTGQDLTKKILEGIGTGGAANATEPQWPYG